MDDNNRLKINRIAFFGRTYAEYISMFDLDEALLKQGYVLDCPAGASSFAAEAHQSCFNVTACDILYNLTVDELIEKGNQDIHHVFAKFDEVSQLYTWKFYKNKAEVMSLRLKALEIFSGDFTNGFTEGRYRYAELPHLPFPDKSFSLVLSGNFLFLYGNRLDINFHSDCIKELLRVCSGELRIFPLVGLDAKPYPYMYDVLSSLRLNGIKAEIVKVPFEFQIGGNQMMRISY